MEDDRYTRITLRIPRDLHARLSDEADRSSKSLNAEIIARLSASFEQAERHAVQLVGKIGDGPSIVDEVARALEDVHEVVAELRMLKRIELPQGTPVRIDRLALLRPLLQAPAVEGKRRQGRPKTSIAGSMKLRRKK